MPLPKDDPRRKKPPVSEPPTPGNKPGTGFLPTRHLTFRNEKIDMAACPPKLEGMYFDDPRASVAATADEMEKWIKGYKQGHRWKNVDQMLIGLWQAKAIPGLAPEKHGEYDGKPTAKEWILLAFTEDGRAYKAWQQVNKGGS